MKYFNFKELDIKNRVEVVVFIISVVFCLVLQWVNMYSTLQPWANRAMILAAALIVIFLSFPFSKNKYGGCFGVGISNQITARDSIINFSSSSAPRLF